MKKINKNRLKEDLDNNVVNLKLTLGEEEKKLTSTLAKYCKAKCGDLKEFGYTSLSPQLIKEALRNIVSKDEKDFTVIEFFIIDDLDYAD